MSLLLIIVVVLVPLALALYAAQKAPIASPFNGLIQVLLVMIAIIYIAHRAGIA